MPGFGVDETGLASYLDTPGFSVLGGRFKEGEKNLRGDTYKDCLKKVWEWPPTHFDGPLGVFINDRCPNSGRIVYAKLDGRFVPAIRAPDKNPAIVRGVLYPVVYPRLATESDFSCPHLIFVKAPSRREW